MASHNNSDPTKQLRLFAFLAKKDDEEEAGESTSQDVLQHDEVRDFVFEVESGKTRSSSHTALFIRSSNL